MNKSIYALRIVLDGYKDCGTFRVMSDSHLGAVETLRTYAWRYFQGLDYGEYLSRVSFPVQEVYQVSPFGGGFDIVAWSEN